MRCLLLIIFFIICAWAALPGEQSKATNFEAQNDNHHAETGPTDGVTATDFEASHASHGRGVVRTVRQTGSKHHQSRTRRQTLSCDLSSKFRSVDGTCNNLNNPMWGSAGQTFRRLLQPAYDDNVQSPRQRTSDSSSDLPSPRNVSTRCHEFDRKRLSSKASVFFMEWGQFLAHDITATPIDLDHMPEDTTACCSETLVISGDLHSNVNSGGPCFPIIISEGDRHFTDVEHRCMEFIRSYPVSENNVRQQINEISAFLDGTNIYGRDADAMAALRDTDGGRLRMTPSNNLEESDTNYCIKTTDDDYCLEAGDSRVNVYPALGIMHTMFVRYHNYVASQLAGQHPTWSSDDIFNNARKIVIAVLQHITYDEYLPAVIGSDAMTRFELSTTFAYNDSCDATLYVFATAAFRFGHSMVPDGLLVDGEEVELKNLFNRPHSVLHSADSLVSGLANSQCERLDRWYSLGMTDHLFEESPMGGLDIVSLNIQRGRDHGLPAYNEWREKCELDKVDSFDQLPGHAVRRYTDTYQVPDDIDLYSGALTESNVDGGIVGETYACLLGQQFANLRKCDRFWWETTDPVTGFENDRQRNHIRRTLLSHVICHTMNIDTIQKRVFRVPDDNTNKPVTCATILANQMDFTFF